jgi:hypothetical protein
VKLGEAPPDQEVAEPGVESEPAAVGRIAIEEAEGGAGEERHVVHGSQDLVLTAEAQRTQRISPLLFSVALCLGGEMPVGVPARDAKECRKSGNEETLFFIPSCFPGFLRNLICQDIVSTGKPVAWLRR